MADEDTVQLVDLIAAFLAGDPSAKDKLIVFANQRFVALAHHMLKDDRMRRWMDTGDLVQESTLRIHRAMERFRPNDEQHFRRFVIQHLRWALQQMARNFYGENGLAANHHSDCSQASSAVELIYQVAGADGSNPQALAELNELELHINDQAAALPADLRNVFEDGYYLGESLTEISKRRGLSYSTVRVRWLKALARVSSNKRLD